MFYRIVCLAFPLFLFSCASFQKTLGIRKTPAPTKDPLGLQAYQAAGGKVNTWGGLAPASQKNQIQGITADEDIVWAPEDPDKKIDSTLQKLWQSEEKNDWLEDPYKGLSLAKDREKPLLLWFTNSARNPLCVKLSAEVFSQQAFDDWARKNIIRVRLDMLRAEGNSDQNLRLRKAFEEIKERYSVHGLPTVILLTPQGSVEKKYRGYLAGESSYYIMRLKKDVQSAQAHYAQWKESYLKRGFRQWKDRRGRTVFAKAIQYKKGIISFVEPDGKRSQVALKALCDADQAWVILKTKRSSPSI